MGAVIPQIYVATNEKIAVRGFYSLGVEVPSTSSGAVIVAGVSISAGATPVNFPSLTRGSYDELIIDATGSGYTATVVFSGGSIEVLA